MQYCLGPPYVDSKCDITPVYLDGGEADRGGGGHKHIPSTPTTQWWGKARSKWPHPNNHITTATRQSWGINRREINAYDGTWPWIWNRHNYARCLCIRRRESIAKGNSFRKLDSAAAAVDTQCNRFTVIEKGNVQMIIIIIVILFVHTVSHKEFACEWTDSVSPFLCICKGEIHSGFVLDCKHHYERNWTVWMNIKAK